MIHRCFQIQYIHNIHPYPYIFTLHILYMSITTMKCVMMNVYIILVDVCSMNTSSSFSSSVFSATRAIPTYILASSFPNPMPVGSSPYLPLRFYLIPYYDLLPHMWSIQQSFPNRIFFYYNAYEWFLATPSMFGLL